ncbi:MAG: zinc ribbon domain-containing protein [Candidatus Eremiobacteraeota bacterium]|nr:zinc ribbon domain-containing protein [Candidatus Eremiobacteraeota bacterium]
MPLYDYQCATCQHVVEIRHGFDDTLDAVCAKCGGELKRVFNPAPIVFKGSGFYINDSRPKSESGSAEPKAAASESKAPAPEPKKSSGSESAA